MKRLLTIVAFCITNAVILQAQDNKPTKEQTVAFLDRTLKETKGWDLPWGWGVVDNTSFKDNSVEYHTNFSMDGETFYESTFTFEDIRWDRFEDMTYNQEGAYYEVMFSVNNTYKNQTIYVHEKLKQTMEDKIETNVQSNLYLFVPEGKVESVKKAILRLVEIAKEENKDPFDD